MLGKDKEQINELRDQGLGYKKIAGILGMSRSTIKAYCKRNDISRKAEAAVLKIEKENVVPCDCLRCGKKLNQVAMGRPRKFCSEECRRKWWSDNPDKKNKSEAANYAFTCDHCGKKFSVYGSSNRKYCSKDCYIKSRFW